MKPYVYVVHNPETDREPELWQLWLHCDAGDLPIIGDEVQPVIGIPNFHAPTPFYKLHRALNAKQVLEYIMAM